MSHTSSKEKEHTVAPRFGAISTSPSASSMVRACRTGVRLTPSFSASCSSTRRSSGPYSPVRIKARNLSTTPAGRDSCPTSRKIRPTKTPFVYYGERLVYNLRRLRNLCQECREQAGIGAPFSLGFLHLYEYGAPRNEGALSKRKRPDGSIVGRRDGLLHLHGLQDEQELSLLDLLALLDEHLHDRTRHRRGQARCGVRTWAGLIHGRRCGL